VSENLKVQWRKPRLLTSLVAVLGRLVKQIVNFPWRSKRLTVDIERKTGHFATDEHRQTSLGLHIDFESECE